MIRAAWLTDVHLNCADYASVRRMYDRLIELNVDQVFVTGDIGESGDVIKYLESMVAELQRPIHFVLGNHDFYYSSIRRIRADAAQLCQRVEELTYLTDCDHVRLTPTAALVGHDGWADAREGDFDRSPIMLNDYGLIAELAGLSKLARRLMLEALGNEAARHIRRVLPPAARDFSQVFLLTHVPPLREACWHDGRTADDDWSPHFTCQVMGQAILEIMPDFPQTQLTVLCGHTHSGGETQPLDNVRILTGGAEYGQPRITHVFEVD